MLSIGVYIKLNQIQTRTNLGNKHNGKSGAKFKFINLLKIIRQSKIKGTLSVQLIGFPLMQCLVCTVYEEKFCISYYIKHSFS